MLPYTPSKVLGRIDRILNLPLFICKRCSMILPILQILLLFSSRNNLLMQHEHFWTAQLLIRISNYHEIQFGNWRKQHIVFCKVIPSKRKLFTVSQKQIVNFKNHNLYQILRMWLYFAYKNYTLFWKSEFIKIAIW